ncbi:unnamed protein product [Symbiodinium sp. CCMP2592]|nr:unnamed protein product [Symbiodinium sp. CCMP2592]
MSSPGSIHGSPAKSDCSTLVLGDHLDATQIDVQESQCTNNQKFTTPERASGRTPFPSPDLADQSTGLTPAMERLRMCTPSPRTRGGTRSLEKETITTPDTKEAPTTPAPVKRLRRTPLLGESLQMHTLLDSPITPLQKRLANSLDLDSPVAPLQKRPADSDSVGGTQQPTQQETKIDEGKLDVFVDDRKGESERGSSSQR